MKYFLLIAVIFLTQNLLAEEQMKIEIVPVPQDVKFNDQKFPLNSNLKIYKNFETKQSDFIVDELRAKFSDSKSIFPEVTNEEKSEGTIQLLKLEKGTLSNNVPDAVLNDAYQLSISDSLVTIRAETERGLYYGAITLGQLIDQSDIYLPGVEILDYPDLPVRGISDDISRGQVSTLENFKRVIDFISSYKMNVYMPYMEDLLKFDNYPSIGEERGALTKDEVKVLIEYAETKFVEIIPVFQTLGHFENILTQEEFLEYAEFPGAASLNVSSEKTYSFLEDLLEEVFELFPSQYFHMGADESWDVGLGMSKHLVDSLGIAGVHLQHYKRVYEIAKKHNKKVLMYGDIILRHPEILKDLPKDIIIVDWHYRPSNDYPSTKVFKESGHKFYVSPSVWNFRATFPAYASALPNIKYLTEEGIEDEASGMINSNWGDYGAETFKEFVLFGYAYSAQCAWNINKTDIYKFSNNFFNEFFGADGEKGSSIYREMSNYSNQIQWNEIWRHPLLDLFKSRSWSPYIPQSGKIIWMKWTLPHIEKEVEELKKSAEKNKDHLDAIQYLIDMNYYFILKNETIFMLHDKMNGREVDENFLTLKIDENVKSLKDLKKRFAELWLKNYKPANLNMIEDKFDRLILYFEEIKDQVKNDLLENPELKTKWIYYPTADSGFQEICDESLIEKDSAKSVVFKKEFELKETPDDALLQLMADTYAKLYINDKFVGEVYARRSGSLLVDYRRIKFFDIKPFLQKGANQITVEVQNFEETNYRGDYKYGDAGLNIASYIKTEDEIKNIDTDNSWMVRRENSEGWENAVERKYRFTIIAPNFETKRTSWIERE